jgi:UDP-glucose 4-epimerase
MKKIYNSHVNIRIIGTRHSEKLYESLLSKEELIHAEDLGDYYRVPSDNRDLNYNKYFTEGNSHIQNLEDYHSHNTRRLSEIELINLLNKIGYKKSS